jgi:hypothetical protein
MPLPFVIETQALCKVYGGQKALDGIDLKVTPQYRNPADGLKKEPRAVAYAEQALKTVQTLSPQDPTEAGRHSLIRRRNGMGVHAQGHRRVGVAESAGHRPHVMALCDRDGGRPMPEIVQSPLRVDASVAPAAVNGARGLRRPSAGISAGEDTDLPDARPLLGQGSP